MRLRNPVENRERVEGIEPSYAAWEAAVLPLNYTRNAQSLRKRGSDGNPRTCASLTQASPSAICYALAYEYATSAENRPRYVEQSEYC